MELNTTKKARKTHTVRKTKDPERANYRQNKREQGNSISKVAESTNNNVDNWG